MGRMRVTAGLFHRGQPLLQRLLGGGLELQVDGRVNMQAAVLLVFGIEQARQLAAHGVERIGFASAGDRLRLDPRGHLFGGLRLRGRKAVFRHHAVQHHVPARERDVGKAERRKLVRPADDGCQHRALVERQVARRFAEIRLRRAFDAVKPAAEKNPVHIEFEDFVLGLGALDPPREGDFQQLAVQRLSFQRIGIAGQLHRHRARALGEIPVAHVPRQRPREAVVIHPVMLVKPVVLAHQQRVEEVPRHLRQRHDDAVLAMQPAHFLAMHIVNDRPLGHRAQLPEIVTTRQARIHHPHPDPCHPRQPARDDPQSQRPAQPPRQPADPPAGAGHVTRGFFRAFRATHHGNIR